MLEKSMEETIIPCSDHTKRSKEAEKEDDKKETRDIIIVDKQNKE